MRSFNLYNLGNQPSAPITRIRGKSVRGLRSRQLLPASDHGDESNHEGRRWSPRSTLLLSTAVSFLLWAGLAAAVLR
jgi:hypothetical protein